MGREHGGGLIVAPDRYTSGQFGRHASCAGRLCEPALGHGRRPHPYGIDRAELFRLTASYGDRFLKGEKPADLPVQLPAAKFELYLNLKTARALGIPFPSTLLGHADEVFE